MADLSDMVYIPVAFKEIPVHELEVGDSLKIYGKVLAIHDAGERFFIDELSGEEYVSPAVNVYVPSQVEGQELDLLYDLYETVNVYTYAGIHVDDLAKPEPEPKTVHIFSGK